MCLPYPPEGEHEMLLFEPVHAQRVSLAFQALCKDALEGPCEARERGGSGFHGGFAIPGEKRPIQPPLRGYGVFSLGDLGQGDPVPWMASPRKGTHPLQRAVCEGLFPWRPQVTWGKAHAPPCHGPSSGRRHD